MQISRRLIGRAKFRLNSKLGSYERFVLRRQKVRDVLPHGVKAVSAVYHFAACGVQAPALIDHAVHRHHKARAIGSVIAVHEHGALFLVLANGAQNLRDLCGLYLPALKRLVCESKLITKRPSVAASAKMAQIYDAFDAKLVQLCGIASIKLSAAKQQLVHAVEIFRFVDEGCFLR